MDRGAWWVTVHGVAESDTTEELNKQASKGCQDIRWDLSFPTIPPVTSRECSLPTRSRKPLPQTPPPGSGPAPPTSSLFQAWKGRGPGVRVTFPKRVCSKDS